MKQHIYSFSFLLIIILLFSSCETVIDINLNSSDPKIVIESNISDISFCKVKLTQSVNFDETNIFPAVTGATVLISDNEGNTEVLTEIAPGMYEGTTMQGVPGRTYTLDITASGKTYTALSTMPQPVTIDSLMTIIPMGGPMAGDKKICVVKFKDPVGVENFYRFIVTVNDTVLNTIIIDSDLLMDGNTIIRPLYEQNYEKQALNSGDSVTVSLLNIDKGVFDYLRTFIDLSGGEGPSSASPANPLSNFTNGALGYFSAHGITSKSIVVP